MMILYAAVIILYILLLFLSRRQRVPPAEYLYGLMKNKKQFPSKTVTEQLHVLHPETGGKKEREEIFIKQYYMKKIRLLLLLVLIGDVFALCLSASGRMDGILEDGKYVNRNTYGGGDAEAALRAEIDKDGEKSLQDFTFTLREQKYEEPLIKQLAKEASEALPTIIPGSNLSLEEVRSDLNLVQEIEGYPFQISWESDNYALIYSDGSVTNEEMEKAAEVVNLTAILSYGDYREEHVIPVLVLPPDYSEEELLRKKVYELITGQEAKTSCRKQVELPEQIDGARLIWEEKKEDSSGILFLLACAAAAAVYLAQDKELKDKAEERNRQMLSDYPQLVGKLTLYMGAGMTIRNSFKRIAGNYEKEKKETDRYRYVYEEMLLTCHELESGVSETAAYEHFGKRCRMRQYTKLSNLLVQNLKKGSNSITEALRQESKNAFEERRNMARKLGEEAGTKLLLPMMLLLGIVMVLIMIPAYFSFSI